MSAASSNEGCSACGGVAGVLPSLDAGFFFRLSERSPLDTGDERTGSRLFTRPGLWQDGRRRIGGFFCVRSAAGFFEITERGMAER